MKAKTLLMAVVLSVGFSACGDKTSVTGKACDVSATSATFVGYVNLPPTELTTASFGIIWGTQKELNWDNKAGYATTRELESNKYSVTKHDLVPETKYFYRSYVCLNDNTYLYGAVKSFTTAQPENLIPYALWCEDNTTLYFIGSDYIWEVGNTHDSQTITALWYGDDIVAQSTDTPAWHSILGNAKYVVFEESFKEIKPKNLSHWFSWLVYEDESMLTDIEGLEYLNTSEATDMSYMFNGCSNLTSLVVSHFDTQNVTDMSGMFNYCSSLTSLDVSHFDTKNVTKMSGMFYRCSNLTSLDVSHFDTQNVRDMGYMFGGCGSLTSLDVSHFNTQNVTNMSIMFRDCGNLTSLDVSHFDTQNVTDMDYMFNSCSNLTTIYCNDTWSCQNSNYMFSSCISLVGAIKYNDNKTDATYANPDTGYFTRK